MASRPDPRLHAEHIRLLYRQAPFVLGAHLVNGVLVVAAMWPLAAPEMLLGWAAVLAAMLLVRTMQLRRYLRHQPPDAEMPMWGRRFVLGSAWAGLTWGAAALLFVDFSHPLSLLLIVFVIGGMAAGAITTLSNYPPAFHVYLGASIIPLTLRLLSEGGNIAWAMAGMSVIFALALAGIGHRYFVSTTENLRLSFEKQRLLDSLERKVQERTAQLEEARKAAEDANMAKSRFLAAASHDLRQPLQSMFLFGELLQGHMADPRGREVLTRMREGLATLKDMLDGLLDLSRLDVGSLRAEPKPFRLAPLLKDLAVAYRPVAESRGLGLEVSCDPEMAVFSDPQLLGRMLRNLLENALRYTSQGGVRLLCHEAADRVRLEVRDTGVGIPPDQLSRIFDEFYQVGNAERGRDRGLGLGLAIVQRLSQILDHPVVVTSEPGKGSTFTIVVPRAGGQ